MTLLVYLGAALAEIAGCFAFWAWLRMDRSPIWVAPGMAFLALFAYLLTLVDAEHAGRTYAAYGGPTLLGRGGAGAGRRRAVASSTRYYYRLLYSTI